MIVKKNIIAGNTAKKKLNENAEALDVMAPR